MIPQTRGAVETRMNMNGYGMLTISGFDNRAAAAVSAMRILGAARS